MATHKIDWRKELERFVTEAQDTDPLKVLAECAFLLESLVIKDKDESDHQPPTH